MRFNKPHWVGSYFSVCLAAVLTLVSSSNLIQAEASERGPQFKRSINHPWVNASYLEGVRAHQSGQYDAAIEAFKESYRTQPYNPNIPFYIADSLSKQGRYNAAKAYYHQSMLIGPNSTAGRKAIEAIEQIDAYNARYGWVYPLDNPSVKANQPSVEELSEPGAYIAELESGVDLESDEIEPAPFLSKQVAYDPSESTPIPLKPDYLGEIAKSNDGIVFYWPLEKMPLKIYLHRNKGTVQLSETEAHKLFENALNQWQAALGKDSAGYDRLGIQWVLAEKEADIELTFTDKLKVRPMNGQYYQEDGLTQFVMKEEQLFLSDNSQPTAVKTHLHVEMTIVTQDMQGKGRANERLQATVTHELGHALGLTGHSDDPRDLMYFSTQQPDAEKSFGTLSERDVQTLRRLYQDR